MCTQEQYYLPKEFSTVFIFANGCFQWWCSKNIFRILQNASRKNIGESLIKIDKERITKSDYQSKITICQNHGLK